MSTDRYDDTRGSAATGWIMFAAAVMFTIGAIDIIQGIVALTKSATYVIPGGEQALLVTTNFDTWGWALIIWGIVLMLAAGSLFAGRSWAGGSGSSRSSSTGSSRSHGSRRIRCGACSRSGSRSRCCGRSPRAGRTRRRSSEATTSHWRTRRIRPGLADVRAARRVPPR